MSARSLQDLAPRRSPLLLQGRGPTLLEAQRWSGSLAAAFAFLGCAVSGELGAVLLVVFPLALVGAHLLGDRAYGKADWAWTFFLAGALFVFGALVVEGRLDIVLGATEFVELLCIHRLWHRRTERDELLLLLLSLLLLSAGAALSAELTYGFAFLAFSVTATWALALTHVRFEIEAGRGPSGSAVLLQSRRIATPRLLGALAALSMMGLVGAAVIFFTFPRVTIGGLRRPSRGTPVAGLNDRIDLSQHGTVADDPRVVLRARLDPPPGRNLLDLHWRARALELWTGTGWQAARAATHPPRLRPPPGARDRARAPKLLTADLEAVAGFSEGVILTPGEWPQSVEFRRPLSASGVQPQVIQNGAGDLFYQPVEIGDLHYLVHAWQPVLPREQLVGRGQDYPESVAPDLAVPERLDARVAALARQLGGGKDPFDAAVAVEAWLSTRLSYTRELAGAVQDPIADFLFQRKKGHCELFSSSMVLMLRSLGIAARNVTGYYGGTLTNAGYYAVRAGDAHSWVEVYFPGVGFVQFDPTPAGDRGGQLDTLWARAVLLWDALQERWRVLIVDYDLLSQMQTAQRAAALMKEAGRRLSGKAGAAPRLRLALTLVFALAAAGLLVWALRRVRFARRPGARLLEQDRKRALQLWRQARARLRRAGIEVEPATTAHEVARKTPAAAEVALAYLAARWGGSELSADRARALLRGLDQKLAAATAGPSPEA